MKAEAILGAVRGGYINTLITDEEAAKAVLALCKYIYIILIKKTVNKLVRLILLVLFITII